MHPVFLQAIYYGVVFVLVLFLVSFLERGFFWKFLKVRVSFGRLIMVKIRSLNRDYFAVGKMQEGFLLFKTPEGYKRISLENREAFYRCLGANWLDIDEKTNNVSNTDYKVLEGYDAIKYNNLYLRALYKPTIAETKEKIILGAIIIMGLIIVAVAFFVYNMSADITAIKEAVFRLSSANVITG